MRHTHDTNARYRLLTFLVIVGVIYGYGVYAGVLADDEFESAKAEAAAIEVINDAREERGLAPLPSNDRLSAYAGNWSAEMADSGFRHGEPFCSAGGENIAMRSVDGDSATDVGEEIAEQWLNSKPHRESIMRPRWSRQGIGIVKTDEYVYSTQQLC